MNEERPEVMSFVLNRYFETDWRTNRSRRHGSDVEQVSAAVFI